MKNTMKISAVIVSLVLGIIILQSCGGKRDPGRVYMPDMQYSRAYEAYADHDTLKAQGINYTALPVKGTIKRGAAFPFTLAKDKDGDSTNYVASKQIVNPIPSLNADELKEAERLYLVNCGICHGMKLDGDGPLYKGGAGPYAAAPKNLITLDMPDGQMFFSITYGKGQMGSYASQLSTTQRWMVIDYIKSKKAGNVPPPAAGTSTTATASTTTTADTAAKK
jgi:mono/diheme cytochrome c family protein